MKHPYDNATPAPQQHWQAAKTLLSDPAVDRLYALVDVGQSADLFADIQSLGLPTVSLLEGTPEGIYDHESPRLFEVHPTDEPTGLKLCQWAQRLPCVSWLSSSHRLDNLVGHLRSWLGAVLLEEDGSELGEVHVRFYDPRVLPALMATLTQAQRAHLLSPLSGWGLWSRLGDWQSWTAPDVDGTSVPLTPKLTLQQNQILDQHTQADRVIWLLEQSFPKPSATNRMIEQLHREFLQQPPITRFRRMFAIREQALRWGLSSDDDMTMYALFAAGVHREFDRHPAVHAQLATMHETGTPFGTILESIPDSVWNQLPAETRTF